MPSMKNAVSQLQAADAGNYGAAASKARPAMSTAEEALARHSRDSGRLTITHTKDWWSFLSEVVMIGGSLVALAYMFNQLIKHQNPEESNKNVAKQVKQQILDIMKKSGRNVPGFNTTPYEDSLLDMIVLPHRIEVRFEDIGGLNHIKRDLMETVLVPLMHPQLTATSRLCAPPLGVLFHGPPGTGKSMMAKAITRETNATFINVDMSRLMSKWYGDSQKYISALFSLARKMAPSIIWIDEIDALFSQRSRTDHQADVYNKALFLSLWDGLANTVYNDPAGNDNVSLRQPSQVIILGATNRPQDVDEAFLRRMSRQYEFTMPNNKTRKLILQIMLQYEKCDNTVDLDRISQQTDVYSGSDLKELCKYAATLPLREYVRSRTTNDVYGSNDVHSSDDESENDLMNIGEDKSLNENSFLGLSYAMTPGFLRNTATDLKTRITAHDTKPPAMQRFSEKLFCEGISVDNTTTDTAPQSMIRLRPITMNDFRTALRHITSTTKAHNAHQMKYGANDNTGGQPMGLTNLFPWMGGNLSGPSAGIHKPTAKGGRKTMEDVDTEDENTNGDPDLDGIDVD